MISLRTLAIAATLFLASFSPPAPSAAQEADHLACVKVKDDPNALPDGPVPVTITDILDDSFSECTVKKAKMISLCIPVANTAVNGGNDPRAGVSAADAYGCYKVKCQIGKPDGSVSADDALVPSRFLTRTKLLTLCAPVDLP